MMSAFDEVLAPLFTTLDCFDSYLDPELAPVDFVDWLASWVGVDIDETWTLERRRRLIQNAAVLYRIRGTAGRPGGPCPALLRASRRRSRKAGMCLVADRGQPPARLAAAPADRAPAR